MFGFPKEDFLRKKWIQAISRKDFAPSKYSKVCELHFSDDAIRRYTEAYNEKTGEKICVPLKRYRLQNFAVPTIFTDFPTYLSNSGNPTRECPEQRLQRLENEHLQRSIQASKEEFEKQKSFMSFPELVECLNAEELQDIWTVICKNDLVIIMMLDTIISPVIKASVIINKDLHLTIHIGQGRRTSGTRAFNGTRHNFSGTSAIKMVCILFQNSKIHYEILRTNASDWLRGALSSVVALVTSWTAVA
ncbi:THAP-type domain-containing protein [Trichonephila clavipes]|nr:THAP-type domain-containing protein [Trichonephila clavipes]